MPVFWDINLLIEAINFFKVPMLVNCDHSILKVILVIFNLSRMNCWQ
jgi:hypothetical protein